MILGGGAFKNKVNDRYQDVPEYFGQIKPMRAVDRILVENEIDFTNPENYLDMEFEMEFPL